MHHCPSCRNELSERGFHCPSCGVQARCRECREILDLGAHFCVNCGASVGEAGLHHEHSNEGNATDPGYNIVEFEEDTRSRRFRAKVSDRAIDSISAPLTLILEQRMGVKAKRSRQHLKTPDTIIDEKQLVLPGLDAGAESAKEQENTSVTEPEEKNSLPGGSEAAQLKEIFRPTSDHKLKLHNPRLKQSSQIDFVERLSVLFLHAYELEERETVSRSDLNAVLSDAKVNNSNARKWIANSDLLSRDGNLIGLSVPGRERAQEVLRQVLDPNFETKWILGSKSNTRTSKESTKEEEDTGQAGSKPSRGRRSRGTSYSAWVRKLADEGILKKGHTGREVLTELERRGHKFELRRINEALVKLTKSEVLSRRKDGSGAWVYRNKEVQ